MIDFTNCPVNRFRAYGGANGNKINITYQGHSYMLKFPPKPSRNRDMSYSNGCISEYVVSATSLKYWAFGRRKRSLGTIQTTAVKQSWWSPVGILQRAENGSSSSPI